MPRTDKPNILIIWGDDIGWFNERAKEDATMFYATWKADRAFLLVPAQAIVAEFLKTFKEFPPRQRPASFSIDQALEKARQQQAAMEMAGSSK